jgi:hypothetical protein
MNIQPVSTYYQGLTVTITQLLLTSVYDNLKDECKFYFALLTASPANLKVQDGNLLMTGATYTAWGSAQDINLAAYQWAAAQLNLTLI